MTSSISREVKTPLRLQNAGDHWVTIGAGPYNVNEEGDKNYRRILLDGSGNVVGGDVPKSAQGKNLGSWWKKEDASGGKDAMKDTVKDTGLSPEERNNFVLYAQKLKGAHFKPEDILDKLDKIGESNPEAHKTAIDAFRADYAQNKDQYSLESARRLSESSREYLSVPYSDKDAAKAGGAKWDKDKRQWYYPDKSAVPPALNQYRKGSTESRERQDQDVKQRAYLDVPYDEKDKAKRAGAQWDSKRRQWYAPHADDVSSTLKKYMPQPKATGEDKSEAGILPASAYGEKEYSKEFHGGGEGYNPITEKRKQQEESQPRSLSEKLLSAEARLSVLKQLQSKGLNIGKPGEAEGLEKWIKENTPETPQKSALTPAQKEFVDKGGWTQEATVERRDKWNTEATKLGTPTQAKINALEKNTVSSFQICNAPFRFMTSQNGSLNNADNHSAPRRIEAKT